MGIWSKLDLGRVDCETLRKRESQSCETRKWSNLTQIGSTWLFVQVNFLPDKDGLYKPISWRSWWPFCNVILVWDTFVLIIRWKDSIKGTTNNPRKKRLTSTFLNVILEFTLVMSSIWVIDCSAKPLELIKVKGKFYSKVEGALEIIWPKTIELFQAINIPPEDLWLGEMRSGQGRYHPLFAM